ncbi:SMI1/KNR4 family protein [Amycolatopsis sulphurea]|uniref:hypothetical protein n=1 Tax=Amycolatopsis sulphurea TaxID=76022 RepID=UPI0011453232|nr:hypothetical protein [Amycolatopsis sulphurea]
MTEAYAPSLVDKIARLLDWREDFTPEKEWSDVERELRISPPGDYKELLKTLPGRRIPRDNYSQPGCEWAGLD